MNKKISFPIAIIIIVVLAVLVGGVIWELRDIPEIELPLSLLTPSSTETAGWKTYKNEEYGFEFKYPRDYSLKTEDYPDQYPDDFWKHIKTLKKIYLAGYQIAIGVSKNDNNSSVNKWLDYINNAPPIMELHPDQNRKAIYISGVEGIDTMRFECCLGCKREIYLPKNSKIYSLKVQGSVGAGLIECKQKKGDAQGCCFTEESEIVFNQILSTFRFLDSDSEEENLEKIAYGLIDEYLNKYKSLDISPEKRLKNYLIEWIDITSVKEDCFGFSVQFSVESFKFSAYWEAGNGEVSGNWVNHKFLVGDIIKEGNDYKIVGMGTGRGASSCSSE